MKPAKRYYEFLQRTGRRRTPPRAAVVDLALALRGLFTAEQVCLRLEGQVSRPTIFRTLGHLVQAEVLRHVQLDGLEVYSATD